MAEIKFGDISKSRSEVATALTAAMRLDGLTQTTLAATLVTSQSTVSKLLRGLHATRPALARRIDDYLSVEREPSPNRLKQIVEAYGKSVNFRRVVDAALRLVNENE